MHESKDLSSTTAKLKALGATGAAEWPSWWRRNLTPGALYLVCGVIAGAIVTVTVDRMQTAYTRRDYEKQMEAMLDVNEQLIQMRIRLERIDGDLVSDRRDLDALANWHAAVTDTAEMKNPYVQRRRK